MPRQSWQQSVAEQTRTYAGSVVKERDWGHAEDLVEAMWLMLQQEEPGGFVATGETYSVHEFVEQRVFDRLDLDWERHVEIDPAPSVRPRLRCY